MTHRETRFRPRSARASLLRASIVGLAAAGLLAAPLVPASAAPGNGNGNSWGQYMQVATRAIPNPQHPNAIDTKVVWGTLRPQGDGPASASARVLNSCTGCTGGATTLQVLTSGVAPSITANNSATAYATGDWARSAAVSVQVILASDARSITASNLASSVNVGCTGCITATAAIQYIASGVPQAQLSPAARSVVLQIERQLALDLNAQAPSSKPARAAHAAAVTAAAAERGRAVIATDTGAVVEARVHADTGD